MREASVWNFKFLLEKLVRAGATRQKTRRPENLTDTDVLRVHAACSPLAGRGAALVLGRSDVGWEGRRQ